MHKCIDGQENPARFFYIKTLSDYGEARAENRCKK